MDMEKEALGRFVFRGERSEDGPTETRRSAEEVENVRRAGSFSFVVSKKKKISASTNMGCSLRFLLWRVRTRGGERRSNHHHDDDDCRSPFNSRDLTSKI